MADLIPGRTATEADGLSLSERPFKFLSLSEMSISPVSWLVDGYFEENCLAVLYGQPGHGKSFLTLDVSCCVASGMPFHGLQVKRGAVFYIAGEGHNGLIRRIQAWCDSHGVSKDALSLFVSDGAIDLFSAQRAIYVEQVIESMVKAADAHPVLIVIDTLARNFGGDENSSADMGAFVRNVDQLRAKWGATTLVVHHSGKDGQRGARGSSALKGAADSEYEVVRTASDGIIHLSPKKMKDAPEPPALSFKLCVVPLRDSAGGECFSAVLTSFGEPQALGKPDTKRLGANQGRALATLQKLLSGGGGTPERESVLLDDWRSACLKDGIDRKRFHEVRAALEQRQAIAVRDAGVSLRIG